MIRTVHIPRTVNRIGIVQAGDGGSAGTYQFDSTGLSSDPRLAYYLESLTPAQLQTALNNGDPTPELLRQLQVDQSGSDLTCGTVASGDPFCNGGQPQGGSGVSSALAWFAGSGIPAWVWITGAGAAAALLLIPRGR